MTHRKIDVQPIDVEDLPVPVARALATVVQTLRKELRPTKQRPHIKVPARPGQVLGHLTRDEIYGDAD